MILMKTVQFNDLKCSKDDLYTLEELITSCEELGLFKIQKVMDGETDTGLWTFEVEE